MVARLPARSRSVRWSRRRAAGRSLRGLGWLVLTALAALAVLRWTHTDSWWVVVVATALSPWLYFLAWVVAALVRPPAAGP